ncbi:MAG TPA: DUF4097 family beta strand repeat-containing protein [Blastocatellia bacterium]|nr:DUF4097 family beta strand repeat-containing protein [Blastocatellia bacterium]
MLGKSLLVSVMFLTAWTTVTVAQDFSKSFKVLPDSGSLEIKTKMGSVTVVPAEGNLIQVLGKRAGNSITASQPSPQGKVQVDVTSDAPVDLVISVPSSTSLDVFCVKCTGGVIVRGLRGAIKINNTGGDIQLTGIHSSQVEARSMSGNVSYSGDVMPSGSYNLRSFSGRVDAALPAGAKFRLNATSGRGGIELEPGDFQLTMQRQTPQFAQGLVDSATATVTLWTQEGSVRVRKK